MLLNRSSKLTLLNFCCSSSRFICCLWEAISLASLSSSTTWNVSPASGVLSNQVLQPVQRDLLLTLAPLSSIMARTFPAIDPAIILSPILRVPF